MGGVPAFFVLKQAFPTLSACDLLGRKDFIATTRSAEIRTLQQGNFWFECLLRSPPSFFLSIVWSNRLFGVLNMIYIYIYLLYFFAGRVLCYLTGCLQPSQVH